MDDSAKLALAPVANAALLAEVMKTRVHAGMGADQLAALAAVAAAAHPPANDAREQVEDERQRREREVDKDRQHQLELLALQNEVNQAALAAQAQLASSLAQAAAACTHAQAGSADRFCGACGAALPARG
jgi:hypothetical protein